uniref:peptidase n=1 Tax=Thaumasiovibrio occultus TaxID=1891184 RepID=UPI000B34B1B0|nr:peptidase [Thaumasiovibrio occultus]
MGISPMVVWIGVAVVIFIMFLLFLTTRFKKVRKEGEALIVNGKNATRATLTSAMVWPVINRMEFMDITRKRISVERSGSRSQVGEEYEGLHCKDNIRADLKVDFYIGVNHNEEDIAHVAKLFTTEGASDIERLKEHFQPKFSEALKTVVRRFEFEELLTERLKFRGDIKEVIGNEMDGFKIYDVVIDKVDQTALDAHDPNNVLDVEGIRLISEKTSDKNTKTNEIRQREQTTIKQQNVNAEKIRLELDKQEKEAEANTRREVEIIEAQQSALAEEKRQEYQRSIELAKLETEEEVSKKRESVEMEVELTRTANERQIAIQREEVDRAVATEKVRTQAEVADREMAKDTAIEESMKSVAEMRSQRVEIERKIAREEEETENLRVNERVNREKRVALVEAEAKAEAKQLELIVTAKAEKEAAKEEAERLLIQKEAELTAKTREAENKLAVTTREAEAAHTVIVKEAEAHQIARVKQAEAEQEALIKKAEAEQVARVKQAEAELEASRTESEAMYIQKDREAAAKERMANAEKEYINATGLAAVNVDRERANVIRETGEAEAHALQSTGVAEAEALRAKGLAEAEATSARFEAAQQYDEKTREYDKWVMELNQAKELELARYDAQREIATANAGALAQALAAADIKLFGGEGMEQLRRTVVDAAVIDNKFSESQVMGSLVSEYQDGTRSLPQDVKDVLEGTDLKSSDLANLALANILNNQGGSVADLLKKITQPGGSSEEKA